MFADGFASRNPLRWVSDVFAARLADLGREPGLVALVDQHAAAIREVIPLDRENLGDYLLGFVDGLRERGWVESGDFDFPVLRLTAICWLIREYGLQFGW